MNQYGILPFRVLILLEGTATCDGLLHRLELDGCCSKLLFLNLFIIVTGIVTIVVVVVVLLIFMIEIFAIIVMIVIAVLVLVGRRKDLNGRLTNFGNDRCLVQNLIQVLHCHMLR